MKTFAQLMEQIPHMDPKPTDVARVKANELAKRIFRRHVHNELSHTASMEQQSKETHRM
jgi:hypothetical protein